MRVCLAVLCLLLMASPAYAQQQAAPETINAALNARICIIDKSRAADGQLFQSCDAPAQNNALLAKGFVIARLDRGTIKSKQPIWVHGMCRYIDNRSPTQDVLVPFGTQEEWTTFNQLVPGILKVAGCCTPRPLTVRDIPEPPSPCIGKWVLQQVVSASAMQRADTANAMLEEKMRPGPNETLLSASGAELSLPVARDDDNTAFTIDAVHEFAARWSCENDEGNTAAPAVAEGEEAPASHGDVLYVSFTVNCTKEQWVPVTLQSFCVAVETNRAYACDMGGYAAGTPGEIIMHEKTLCPKGTTTRQLVQNNCEGDVVAQPSPAVVPTPDLDAPAAAPAAAPAPAPDADKKPAKGEKPAQ